MLFGVVMCRYRGGCACEIGMPVHKPMMLVLGYFVGSDARSGSGRIGMPMDEARSAMPDYRMVMGSRLGLDGGRRRYGQSDGHYSTQGQGRDRQPCYFPQHWICSLSGREEFD
jgi:hypothetical protein